MAWHAWALPGSASDRSITPGHLCTMPKEQIISYSRMPFDTTTLENRIFMCWCYIRRISDCKSDTRIGFPLVDLLGVGSSPSEIRLVPDNIRPSQGMWEYTHFTASHPLDLSREQVATIKNSALWCVNNVNLLTMSRHQVWSECQACKGTPFSLWERQQGQARLLSPGF